MALSLKSEIFINGDIREALGVIERVGSRRKLGISRWDNVLDVYPYSGTVVIPVKFCNRVFREPFYFVVEKVNDKESLRIRPVEGEQWSIGDVYGFFGLSGFNDYTYDMPILVVEGLSDWAACRGYYKYVLSSNSAWIGYRQAYFLSALSKNIVIGWDSDSTGVSNRDRAKEVLSKFDCNIGFISPSKKDWGKMYETEFGKEVLARTMNGFLEYVNGVNYKILYGR